MAVASACAYWVPPPHQFPGFGPWSAETGSPETCGNRVETLGPGMPLLWSRIAVTPNVSSLGLADRSLFVKRHAPHVLSIQYPATVSDHPSPCSVPVCVNAACMWPRFGGRSRARGLPSGHLHVQLSSKAFDMSDRSSGNIQTPRAQCVASPNY